MKLRFNLDPNNSNLKSEIEAFMSWGIIYFFIMYFASVLLMGLNIKSFGLAIILAGFFILVNSIGFYVLKLHYITQDQKNMLTYKLNQIIHLLEENKNPSSSSSMDDFDDDDDDIPFDNNHN